MNVNLIGGCITNPTNLTKKADTESNWSLREVNFMHHGAVFRFIAEPDIQSGKECAYG